MRRVTEAGSPSADDWDTYWLAQRKSESVYASIAQLYRKLIISRSLARIFRRHVPRGAKCLHAGAGSGEVDVVLNGEWEIIGLDFSHEATMKYRSAHGENDSVLRANNFDLPFPENCLDCVFNLGVMEHFEMSEIEAMATEFLRVLRPGGIIILFWPPTYGTSVVFLRIVHKLAQLMQPGFKPLHPREISLVSSRRKVRTLLESVGFTQVQFRFEARDLFTHEVVVATKLPNLPG